MINAGAKGEYRACVVGPDGNVKDSVDWFDNLLLDGFFSFIQGMTSAVYYGNQFKVLRVGTGTAEPVESQTVMGNLLASCSAGYAGSGQYAESGITTNGTTWTCDCTMTFPFGQGQVVGNITEVGFALNSSVGASIVHSRALIKDGQNVLRPLTVTAEDQLIVTYKLTLSGSDSDTTGSISLNGTLHNYISRRTQNSVYPVGEWLTNNTGSTSAAYAASNGALNAAGTAATGTVASMTTDYEPGLVPGQRRMILSLATNEGNLSGGIKVIQWGYSGKMEFTPPINKTSDMTLSLTVGYIIGRAS
jgi:hypothetical protein